MTRLNGPTFSSVLKSFSVSSVCSVALLASAFIGVHPWFQTPAAAQDNALDVEAAMTETAADIPEVPREFRAAWIATVANIDWPTEPGLSTADQQKEMLALLDLCDELNLNAIVFQVRPHADAMYDSKIEPWSYYLTGEQGQAPDPYYDPLKFTVDEAHRRGIEVHVWFNPYRAMHPDNLSGNDTLADNHVANTMPDAVKKLGEKQNMWWMDPGDRRVQQQSLDVIADVVDRYDVDGIHFDDYFYPYPSYNDGNDFPDDASYKAYQDAGGRLNRGDWRRKSVNDFVEELHSVIKARKPHVKFGISPFGIYRPGHPDYIKGFDQYEELYADAHFWLERGWVDYMTPQLYWEIRNPDQSFVGLLKWWNDHNPEGRHIWPGLYTSRLNSENPTFDDDEIPMQIKWTRVLTQPSSGHVHFSIKALQKDSREVATKLKAGYYGDDALVPASPWMSEGQPAAPTFTAQREDDTVTVTLEEAPPGLAWVVQVGVEGRWTHTVVPGTETTTTVTLPAPQALEAGPEATNRVPRGFNEDEPSDDQAVEPAEPANPDALDITVAVFTVDRAGVASEKTVETITSQWERTPR